MSLDMNFLISLVFSFLDFTSLTLLSLSVYRIPILSQWKRLLFLQGLFIIIMYLHNMVMPTKDYYAILIAGSAILLSVFILKIPLLYSSLIWTTGYLLHTLIGTGLIILAITTGIVSIVDLIENPMLSNVAMFLDFLIVLSIMYFINKKRLGYMFVMNKFRIGKRAFQVKDFFVAGFCVSAVSIVQFGFGTYFSKQINHSLLTVLVSMITISLIGLYLTYKFNMKEIEERFSSFRGK